MKIKFDKYDYLFILFILFILFLHLIPLMNFEQLPSPLYGGDYYHQMGAVNHVKYGGNIFESFATIGDSIPSYFPLYTLIVGSFAKFTDLGAMDSMFIFSLIFLVLSSIILYILGNNLFRNKILSLLFVASYFIFNSFIIKYTDMVKLIFFPLFFLFLYLTLKNKSYFYAVLTGLLYGLNSIGHGTGFTFLSLFLVLISFFLFFTQNFKNNKFLKEKFRNNFKFNIFILMIIFFIGFLIAQLYWFESLFKFHANVPNSITDWGQSDYSMFSVKLDFVKSMFKQIFNFSNLFYSLRSILFLIGTFSLFNLNKKSLSIKYIKLLFASFFIIPLHFLITLPLFGFELSPHYMLGFISSLVIPLIVPFSFIFFKSIMGKQKLKYLALIFFLLLVLFSSLSFNNNLNENKWMKVGYQEFSSPYLIDVSDWLVTNTDINDGFISSKEIGSSINSLTGRKFLSIRRNQHPITSYVDEREADLAVILHGNNDKVKEELFKKYNISYLYWDINWIRSEFIFSQDGEVVGYFDPIMIIKTEEMKNYLNQNGVPFVEENIVIDSAKRNDEFIKKFDVLVVSKMEIDMYQPWGDSLNKYLELEKEFLYNNQTVAKIFKINY